MISKFLVFHIMQFVRNTVASQQEGSRFESTGSRSLPVLNLHVLTFFLCLGRFGFLLQSKKQACGHGGVVDKVLEVYTICMYASMYA